MICSVKNCHKPSEVTDYLYCVIGQVYVYLCHDHYKEKLTREDKR